MFSLGITSVFDKTVPIFVLVDRVVFLGECSPDTILNVSTTVLAILSFVNSVDEILVSILPEESNRQVLILYIRLSDRFWFAIPLFCGTNNEPSWGCSEIYPPVFKSFAPLVALYKL